MHRPGPHIDLICPIEEGETSHVELDASQGDDAGREDLEARIFTEVEPGQIRVLLDREYPESVDVLVAVHGEEGTTTRTPLASARVRSGQEPDA